MTKEEANLSCKKGLRESTMITLLAAGLGRRMEPLTSHHLPKPMFPLGGNTPMIEAWVKKAVQAGIGEISMNLCVLGDTIAKHFKNGEEFGAKIRYVWENSPSGTLGGVCKQVLGRKAKRVFDGETMPETAEFKGATIIAPSGDIVTNFGAQLLEKLYEIHKSKGAAFTMVLTPVPWEKRSEFGTVALDLPQRLSGIISKSGRVSEFREKDPNSPSNLNNASIYIIEKDFLKMLDPLRTRASSGEKEAFYDFGKHVFPAMLGKLEYINLPKDLLLWGIQYDGLWYDVGRKRDYLMVNNAFLDGKIEMEASGAKHSWGQMGENVDIDFSKVVIAPPVFIGDNCVIEPETTLGPYAVIGNGWRIGKGAKVKNSVLWKRCSFFGDNGVEITVEQRQSVDKHEVRAGVVVDRCIVVGGEIDSAISEQVVDIGQDGRTKIVSLDFIPEGPRA